MSDKLLESDPILRRIISYQKELNSYLLKLSVHKHDQGLMSTLSNIYCFSDLIKIGIFMESYLQELQACSEQIYYKYLGDTQLKDLPQDLSSIVDTILSIRNIVIRYPSKTYVFEIIKKPLDPDYRIKFLTDHRGFWPECPFW